MRYEPGLKEDAKNLSVVGGSAVLAWLVTLGLLAEGMSAEREVDVAVVREIRPEVVERVEIEPVAEPRAPLTGTNRLHGTVRTVHGSEFTGYLRWDRNEGSWTDLLDATKPRVRGGSSISGIRFGHIGRLEVAGRDAALVTLRSGERVTLTANATDLGPGLRALVVDDGGGNVVELGWRDLESVEFEAAGETPPAERRLHGTVTTRSGAEFTGYVTWDVDEIYSTDVLDGDSNGQRMHIPFGEIEGIERYASWGSRVTLTNGERYVLEGTNDVDASINGIEVSDPTLGSVKLQWESFDNLRFHEVAEDVVGTGFDGGSAIRGTVETRDGTRYTGDIVWDADETRTWEMLNGEMDGIQLHVEFAKIARIERTNRGALVTLEDGRAFELSGSNDVDHGNRGITIRTDGREYEVDWSDFGSLTLSE